ncbi:hypothetical protein AvCA_02160 [Azotobacter vinelandii CA]|uniref:Uncharacterized protein n=2 Tax=Azotobacter vinelandii TaxID=354 RepID=C1DH70_AZOVD|nr:hypothetical protein Avin_02160 [Azotobacter vinelandii DJ]AGK17387.1 hypothetical protein AvCA_02160 [Azotobacter vinelandii CA]AGK19149.1 hypothetical protein AvCA6_02160 [Azotobacter vinelandii CA6]
MPSAFETRGENHGRLERLLHKSGLIRYVAA